MSSSKSLPDKCTQILADHMRPDLFKALCDPMRISIIATLSVTAEPQTVGNITECCGIDFSGVSRHLKILKAAGIVNADKNGREMLYSLKTEELADTLHSMADALIACRNIAS